MIFWLMISSCTSACGVSPEERDLEISCEMISLEFTSCDWTFETSGERLAGSGLSVTIDGAKSRSVNKFRLNGKMPVFSKPDVIFSLIHLNSLIDALDIFQ